MKNLFKALFFIIIGAVFLFMVNDFPANNNQDVYASQEDPRVERLMDLLSRTERLIKVIEELEKSGEDVDMDILLLKMQLVEMRIRIKAILEDLIKDIEEELWWIDITSPKGGENWQGAKTYDIRWNSVGVKNVSFSVCGETPLLPQKYTCWDFGNRRIDASLRSYSWTIDANSPWIPGDVRLRITDTDTGKYVESNVFNVREKITDTERTVLECRFDVIMAQLNARDRNCGILDSKAKLDCGGLITHETNNRCIKDFLKNRGWSVLDVIYWGPYISSISPRTGSSGDTITIHGRNLIGTVPSGIGIEFLQNNRSIGVVDRDDTIREDRNGQFLQFKLGRLVVSSFSWARHRDIEDGVYQIRTWNDDGKSNTVDFEVQSSQIVPRGGIKCAGLGEESIDLDLSFSNTGLNVTLFRDSHRVWGWNMDEASARRGYNGTVTSRNLTPNTSYTYRLVNGTSISSPEIARVVCRTASSSNLTARITSFSGGKSIYFPGEKITAFVAGRMSNGQTANPDDGFHVQTYVYREGSDRYLTPDPRDSYNATYNSRRGGWEISMNAPRSAGRYRLSASLYCSRDEYFNGNCTSKDDGDKVWLDFTVPNIIPIAQGSLSCASASNLSLDLNFSFSNAGSVVTLFQDNRRIESWHGFSASGHRGVTTAGDLTPNTSYTYRLVNGTSTSSPELARVVCRTASSSNLTARVTSFTGGKDFFAPRENISIFVAGRMSNGQTANPDDGFHVQAYIYRVGSDGRNTETIEGVNATYNSRRGGWEASMTAPRSTGSYRLEASLYCSSSRGNCDPHGSNSQHTVSFNFQVSDRLSNILDRLTASLISLREAR